VPYVSLAVPGGEAHTVILDTGAPLVMLDPRVFTLAPAPDALSVFNGTLSHVTVVPLTACASAPCAFDSLNGLLGGAGLLPLRVTLDPKHSVVRINARDAVADTLSPHTVSFTPMGAGRYQFPDAVHDVPATRIVLVGAVESLPPGRYLLDTGASFVALRTEVFDTLVHDGRAVQTRTLQTVQGSVTTRVARASSFTLEGTAPTPDVLVTSDVPIDFDALARETNGPIEGLLGGSFLRNYAVTIDYPAHTVSFARYTDTAHVQDEFVRVGIQLRVDVSAVRVRAVIDPSSVSRTLTATERACLVNATVISIDGVPVLPGPLDAIDVRLRGHVGDTRTVEIRDACDGSAHTYPWPVEALL